MVHLIEPKDTNMNHFISSKRKKVRVKFVLTGEISTVDVATATKLVASGDWEYVEGV